MQSDEVMAALAALAQGTRLEAFRLLVAHEPRGLAAGEVARRLGVPHNTMSTHLAVLARAGLVATERHSRTIQCRAAVDRLRQLVNFLVEDCCQGRPDTCAPAVASLAACCPPEPEHA